ncbi:acetyl-CoA carboxylase [Secundilactobacillus pentosiphilus]|uniref:Acetyl-CoA carboxylase n=1 Tax=Secundilactobacillus pentosiphilus TaxID=1714682 RepID=A0A1Z5IVB5_9LACO|nr:acetyl-CoA carboxylase [Secundilactobacillus pentosiphilus]GAX05381.1 acetyl-CoA carboxylase [Secundilactobacillus pentosiphilus]
MTPAKEAELIYSRIEPLFKHMSRTRYQISISNDPYDKTYNFFFESQHAGMRLKSTPLHSLTDYRLEFLEQVVDDLKKHTKLTIQYTGFAGEVWPVKQTVIQKSKNPLE